MKRAPMQTVNYTAQPQRPHRRPLRVGLFATGTIALVALLLPAVKCPDLRLVWNASASVPLGLYRIEPGERARVGELVAVRPSPALTRFMAERRYVEANALLLKPLAAKGGATVCRVGMRVTINGQYVATALPRDRFRRPLPRWSGCLRLRPNQLFLIAPKTAASFDSRYFGPVNRNRIIGRAVPLWTWS